MSVDMKEALALLQAEVQRQNEAAIATGKATLTQIRLAVTALGSSATP